MGQQQQAKLKVPSKAPSIVEITQRSDDLSVGGMRPKKRRRIFLALSFIIFVLIPAVLGSYYFAFIASERYAASAGFSVRGLETGSGLDGLGSLTGLVSSGSTTSDSYVIEKYLSSRDIVERLQMDFDLKSAFSQDGIDSISRFRPDASIEDLVEYWNTMVSTTLDPSSGVIVFEVQAYTAADAYKISNLALQYTQTLINHMSESARLDSVRFAEGEVKRSEDRLRNALSALREFRAQEGSIDPTASAQLDIELMSSLESRLIDLRTRIRAISGRVEADAPSLVSLRQQEQALQEQISQQARGIGVGSEKSFTGTATSDLLETYQTLEVEKTFAEQSYASSLASLEKARIEADRQQRYLAVYSAPAMPEDPIYPKRIANILVLIFSVFSIWGIGALIVYSVRDHLS